MTQKEKKRIHSDFEWLNKNMFRLQAKFPGKFIAVVNKHVSTGKDALDAYNKSKKLFPKFEPLLDIVPTKDTLLL